MAFGLKKLISQESCRGRIPVSKMAIYSLGCYRESRRIYVLCSQGA